MEPKDGRAVPRHREPAPAGRSGETEQFATKADLASLETQMVDRIGQLETRLTRDINNHDWRMIGAIITVVSVAVAALKLIP